MFKTNKLQQLKKQSNDALSIFRNTKSKLEDANKEIRFVKSQRQKTLEELQAELKEYDEMEQGNEKLVTKIDSLLN